MTEVNFGEGKYFSYGLICTFKGKKIPCGTYISESGGITAEILVETLKILDDLGVFDRASRKIPCLIIDGHESWLSTTSTSKK
jgi:hypothetical protein